MPLADSVVVAAAASVALAPLETGAASPATVARVPPKWSSQKVSLLRAVVVVVVVVVVEGSSTVSITDDGLSQLSDTFISLKKVFPKSTNHFFFNNSVAALQNSNDVPQALHHPRARRHGRRHVPLRLLRPRQVRVQPQGFMHLQMHSKALWILGATAIAKVPIK